MSVVLKKGAGDWRASGLPELLLGVAGNGTGDPDEIALHTVTLGQAAFIGEIGAEGPHMG
jgi:hypothetical protein